MNGMAALSVLRRRNIVVALLIVACVVTLAVGAAVGYLYETGANGKAAQQPAAAAPVVKAQASSAPPRAPARPATPEGALALTDQQATDELGLRAAESIPQLVPLRGTWVPQVAANCTAMAADVGPNWLPDGAVETANLTPQQLLALHLSLRSHFDAITTRPTRVGVRSNRPTGGRCAAKVLWLSIVPRSFRTPQAANAWCAVNMAPGGGCGARYVARAGEQSRFTISP